MDLDARLDAIQQQASNSADTRGVRATARTAARAERSKLGLSTQQGAVDSIKNYAALHASREDAQRNILTQTAFSQASDPEAAVRARRDFAEAARTKVQTAAAVFRLQKKKKAREAGAAARVASSSNAADSPSESESEPTADSLKTLEELQAERQLMARLGFNDKAREFDARVQHLRAERARARLARDEKLLQQRLWALELSQRQRRSKLLVEHEGALMAEEAGRKRDKEELASAQAAECQELIETVTKAAALEDVELPRQLAKYRYRHSKRLLSLKENAERLRGGGRPAQAAPFEAEAEALEEQEVARWQEKFLAVALGGEASSVISQLMASHKVSQDKLNDRQRKAAHQAEKGKARELANLEGGFRVERWKVIEACKKAAIAREEAEQREQQRAAALSWHGGRHTVPARGLAT